ncbi:MAG: GNAT family N-acetyltransferase [Alphaproteobacteria bacterium]|jgi:GNAT superfamily N-acetyltransferase
MTVEISTGWRPGIIGNVVTAHAQYYAREWGFGPIFEAKVAEEMAEFIHRYDVARDCLFAATSVDGFLASLTIDGTDAELAEGQAHLRWFITSDLARGTGIGGRLMEGAMTFLQTTGFSSCYLTTFAGLEPARKLYERHGFVLTTEEEAKSWGVTVREQRWELTL